ARRVERELLLRAVPWPGMEQDPVGEPARDGDRPIGGAAVDDDELVAPGDAREAALDHPLLVLRDHRAGDAGRRPADSGQATRALARRRPPDRPDPLPPLGPRAIRSEVGDEEPQ